jgi:formyl-CoA transferase
MLDEAITAYTSRHDLEHVLKVLGDAEVPVGRIYTAADIYEDAHYRARDMIQRFSLPDGEPVDLPAIVPKLSGTPGETRWLGPALGAHTDEVLRSLGKSPDEIDALRREGVI